MLYFNNEMSVIYSSLLSALDPVKCDLEIKAMSVSLLTNAAKPRTFYSLLLLESFHHSIC